MVAKPDSVKAIRLFNRSLVLKLLRDEGPLSRAEMAEKLNLTPAAISKISNEMIDQHILYESGMVEEARLGRKRVLVDIRYDVRCVLGVSIETDFIKISLADLSGTVKKTCSFETDRFMPPIEILAHIAEEINELLTLEGVEKNRLLGVGVGITGIVDAKRGISLHAYGIWNQPVSVRSILEKFLSVPVVVDSNIRALALMEMLHNPELFEKTVLFAKFSPGISGALSVRGELYTGSHSAACEFGHMVVNPQGRLCKCGQRGCLDTTCSESSVLRDALRLFGETSTPTLYSLAKGNPLEVTIDHVYIAAEYDPPIAALMEQALSQIALVLLNSVRLFDPDQIIVLSTVYRHKYMVDRFRQILRELFSGVDIERFAHRSSFYALSNSPDTQDGTGGVALALSAFFYGV